MSTSIFLDPDNSGEWNLQTRHLQDSNTLHGIS